MGCACSSISPKCPAEILVVGADIGLARRAGRVGVEGDDVDAGVARRLDDAGHGTDIGDRDRQAVDALGDEILDDLDLGRGLVLDRPAIDAFDVAEFGGALHAAVAGDVEEGVVHRLGHDGKSQFVRSPGRGGQHDRDERREHHTLHAFPPVR